MYNPLRIYYKKISSKYIQQNTMCKINIPRITRAQFENQIFQYAQKGRFCSAPRGMFPVFSSSQFTLTRYLFPRRMIGFPSIHLRVFGNSVYFASRKEIAASSTFMRFRCAKRTLKMVRHIRRLFGSKVALYFVEYFK